MNIKIAYLKNYQEYITAVASWSYDIGYQYDPQMTRKGQIQKFKQRCNIDKLPLTLVALDDNDFIIGMCSLSKNEFVRSDLTPWLISLYVIPDYRNQKVAEKLIDASRRIARSLDYDFLYLLSFDRKSTSYYANQDWALIGEDMLNDQPVFIMETKLAQSLIIPDSIVSV